jgi:indole-3-acetate monooxygenase
MLDSTLTTPSSVLDPDDLAAQLAPSILACAEEADRRRDIPEDLLGKIRASGALRLLTPRELGGLEVPPTTALKVYEALGRVDASVAWIVWNANWGFIGALLDEPGRARLWRSDVDPVFANAAPAGQPGAALPTEDGYVVSGDWKMVSGVNGADWVIAAAVVMQDGKPLMTDAGPDVRLFPLRRDQLTVRDTWNVSGMRGTGSNEVVVKDAVVPAELVASSARPYINRPLYRGFIPALVYPGSASVVLGVAQAAVDETVRLAKARKRLAERAHCQSVIAGSQASLQAARLLLHSAADALAAAAERGVPVTLDQRADLRAAVAHAALVSRDVLMAMYQLGSSASVYVGSPLERLFRDGMVALQHFSLSTAYAEAVGRVRLGMQPQMPLF